MDTKIRNEMKSILRKLDKYEDQIDDSITSLNRFPPDKAKSKAIMSLHEVGTKISESRNVLEGIISESVLQT